MSRLLVLLLSTLGASIGLGGMLWIISAAWGALPGLHPAPWLYFTSLIGYGWMAIRWMGGSRMGPGTARFFARITVVALLALPVETLFRTRFDWSLAAMLFIVEIASMCTLLMLYVYLVAFHADEGQGA